MNNSINSKQKPEGKQQSNAIHDLGEHCRQSLLWIHSQQCEWRLCIIEENPKTGEEIDSLQTEGTPLFERRSQSGQQRQDSKGRHGVLR